MNQAPATISSHQACTPQVGAALRLLGLPIPVSLADRLGVQRWLRVERDESGHSGPTRMWLSWLLDEVSQ